MATNNTTLAANLTMTIEDINHIKFLDNLPILVFYVIIMVVGIVGNVLVLIIYKLQFKRSSARVYILTLAMTDLSVCVIGIPYHVLDIAMVVTYPNAIVCKVLSFLIGSCTLSSIFVLLVVGLDRYLKVCRPLKKQIIDFGDKRACLIVIAMAVVINIPNCIIYGNNSVTTDGINGTECFVSDDFQSSMLSIGYLGLILIIFIGSVTYLSIIYGFIVRKIYKTDPNQGEISIGNKNKWCSCVSPDTDSDNSDKEDENNGTPAETSILMKRQGATNKPSNGIYIETRHDVSAESINTETGSLDVSDSETNKTMSEGGDSGEEQTLNKSEQDRRDNLDVKQTLVNASESHDNRRRSQPHKQKRRDKSKVKHVPSASMMRNTKKNDSKSKESHTRKITLIMFTITIVFIASYLPFIIISILDQVIEDYWERMTNSETILHNFLLRFYLINNMADPIIYGLWDKRFRSECVFFLRSICCCGKEDFRNRNRKKFSLATSTSKGYPSSAKSSRRHTANL